MKLHLKEDPKEWRKQALLASMGLTLISSLLRWRHHLSQNLWLGLLVVLGGISICAWLRPHLFRGYYRFSMRWGFALSQILGFLALVIFFLLIITPVGLILRLAGKDPLQLRRPANALTFWQSSKNHSPLDRLF